MKRRAFRLLFLAALAASIAACASLRPKSPDVTLSGVDIKEFGLIEQRLGLTLRVANPNETDLDIDGVDFEVEVNGQGFAKGVSNKPVKVPRLGEATMELTAVTTLGGLFKQLGELARAGRDSVEYRIRGHFHGNGMRNVPFDSKRELKLPKWMSPPGERPGTTTGRGQAT